MGDGKSEFHLQEELLLGVLNHRLLNLVIAQVYMGGCQNYGPFLGPYYNTAPDISGTQKGTIILTTTHMLAMLVSQFLCVRMNKKFESFRRRLYLWCTPMFGLVMILKWA